MRWIAFFDHLETGHFEGLQPALGPDAVPADGCCQHVQGQWIAEKVVTSDADFDARHRQVGLRAILKVHSNLLCEARCRFGRQRLLPGATFRASRGGLLRRVVTDSDEGDADFGHAGVTLRAALDLDGHHPAYGQSLAVQLTAAIREAWYRLLSAANKMASPDAGQLSALERCPKVAWLDCLGWRRCSPG